MKKLISIIGLSLVFFGEFGMAVYAQTSQEVTETVIVSYYSTVKTIPLGENLVYTTFESFGVTVSDTGEGLFHGATVRALGAMTIEKGAYVDKIYAVFNLRNGDKVFVTASCTGKRGATGEGTTTFIGGTGKCAGIQGSGEFTRHSLRPASEGISQSYNKLKIRYRLP